jgi:hypothetical protein
MGNVLVPQYMVTKSFALSAAIELTPKHVTHESLNKKVITQMCSVEQNYQKDEKRWLTNLVCSASSVYSLAWANKALSALWLAASLAACRSYPRP